MLPYYDKPPILAKNVYPHMLTIAMNSSNALKWIAESFVQLFVEYDINDNDVDPIFYLYDKGHYAHSYEYMVSMNRCCPFLSIYRHPYNEIDELGMGGLVDYLKNKILNGYYIMIQVDVAKIKAYGYDRNKFIQHSPLLIGFNESKNIFYFRDFCGLYYNTHVVTYKELEEAFFSFLSPENGCTSVSINIDYGISCIKLKETEYQFDLAILKYHLKNYIKIDNTQQNNMRFIGNKDIFYGVDIFDILIKYIENKLSKDSSNIGGMTKFNHLVDHKKTMLIRNNFLKENSYITDSEYQKLLVEFTEAQSIATTLQNLYFKYNMQKNDKIAYRIISNINKLKSMDMDTVKYLIDII